MNKVWIELSKSPIEMVPDGYLLVEIKNGENFDYAACFIGENGETLHSTDMYEDDLSPFCWSLVTRYILIEDIENVK